MASLLLRIDGCMQSWGTRSRFQNRDTEREPTFSGIIGICAAAMGIPRDGDLSVFSGIRMHVRADREGKVAKDFQTAQNVSTADKKKGDMISDRWHLQDAAFLVCLEGDSDILQRIQSALKNPKWMLYLGRKSYVPSLPVWLEDGFRENESAEELFISYPLLRDPRKEDNGKVRLIMETDDYLSEFRNDRPLSFVPSDRRYEDRYIKMLYIDKDSIKGGCDVSDTA